MQQFYEDQRARLWARLHLTRRALRRPHYRDLPKERKIFVGRNIIKAWIAVGMPDPKTL